MGNNNGAFILWLPSWYPSKSDAYVGDFIQRHAKAASVLHNVLVLYITDAEIKTPLEKDTSSTKNLIEEIVYFKKKKSIFFRIAKQFIWFNLYKTTIENYIAKFGKPACVHVNVAWKAGIIAMWMKKKYDIPYIITEHWGIYNTVVKDNYFSKPVYFKKIVKKIYRNAECFLSVSKFLAENVSAIVHKKGYSLVSNVVDTDLFFFDHKEKSFFTFLHVSNMINLKNVPGILEALKSLIDQKIVRVRLVLVGNRYDEHHNLASDLQLLDRYVFFKGEIPYGEVAKEMRSADCFILNSNMENSPCVIGEALCCGLPVIATNVGGVPELLNKENGILIPPNDNISLTDAMKTMIFNSNSYKRKEIALQAQTKFNYLTFSRQLIEIYSKVKSGKVIS